MQVEYFYKGELYGDDADKIAEKSGYLDVEVYSDKDVYIIVLDDEKDVVFSKYLYGEGQKF